MACVTDRRRTTATIDRTSHRAGCHRSIADGAELHDLTNTRHFIEMVRSCGGSHQFGLVRLGVTIDSMTHASPIPQVA